MDSRQCGNRLRRVGALALRASMVGLLLLGACGTKGRDFETTGLEALRPGEATIADVVAKVGPPQSTIRRPDGRTLLRWEVGFVNGPNMRVKSMAAMFDTNGRLVWIGPPHSRRASSIFH